MTLNVQVETITLSVKSLGKIFSSGAVRLKLLTEMLAPFLTVKIMTIFSKLTLFSKINLAKTG
jgi:hypothetical protein